MVDSLHMHLSAQACTQVPPVYQISISTQCQICAPVPTLVQYEHRTKAAYLRRQLGIGIWPFAVRVCVREVVLRKKRRGRCSTIATWENGAKRYRILIFERDPSGIWWHACLCCGSPKPSRLPRLNTSRRAREGGAHQRGELIALRDAADTQVPSKKIKTKKKLKYLAALLISILPLGKAAGAACADHRRPPRQ